MHPLAAMALSSAVEGFSKELGSQLAARLFGVGGSDTAGIKKALKQIAAELRVINQKLDYMTSLLERLPTVLLAQYRREQLDDGYRLLQATDDVLRATGDGELKPPTREFAIQLLSAWRRVIELEDRPQHLMMLPYWTELTRFTVAGDISSILSDGVGTKLLALDTAIDANEKTLSEAYSEGDALVAQNLFSSGRTIAAAPYIAWVEAPIPYRIRQGGHDGNLDIRIYDQNFANRQKAAVKRLNALRATISAAHAVINASVPPAEMLRTYLAVGRAPENKSITMPYELDQWQNAPAINFIPADS